MLQTLASIQKRTSPKKFAHLAEKSKEGSVSNLSTKVLAAQRAVSKKRKQTAKPKDGGVGLLSSFYGITAADMQERY